MKRHWRTIGIVTAVVVIALSVVAVAYGATRTTRRAAGNAACGALMSNPKAVKAMQGLRAEHRQEMQAWIDQYGADPSSAEAQAALKALREEHWNDMRDLFKKLGIEAPAGVGPGGMMGGPGGCGAACGGAGSGAGAQGTGYGSGMMGSSGGMMGGWSY
jgi:hypothetical protein